MTFMKEPKNCPYCGTPGKPWRGKKNAKAELEG